HELRHLPIGERKLRIGNIRVNAAQLGHSSMAQPTRIAMYITISEVSVYPTSNLLVANLAGDYHVVTRIVNAHSEPRRFTQSISVNEVLRTEREGTAELSMLVTFSGRLASFEQIPGQRTRLMLSFGAMPAGISLYATKEA